MKKDYQFILLYFIVPVGEGQNPQLLAGSFSSSKVV